MPGSKARSKGIFYVFSREHQIACRSAVLGEGETKPPVWPIVTVLVGSAGGPK